MKAPPILVQAETQRDKTAAQKKANGTESVINAEIKAEDETEKAGVKEAIEKESKGDHSESNQSLLTQIADKDVCS